ncbi:MAG: DUF951 domain-containing protein [Lachnospiraceae bacterium]|nr:DUF951 domain-containing protein [Lachnospiraceae bacterium]
MKIEENDILIMKKPHPCGSNEWKVIRVGADCRIECVGCGHQTMITRTKLAKNVKDIQKPLEKKGQA